MSNQQWENLLSFQYTSFKKWNRCYKASSCSVSVTLKQNIEKEVVCIWRYNISQTVVGIMFIGTTKTNLASTMHPATSETPNKTTETLSPQMSKIGPYAIKYTGQQ